MTMSIIIGLAAILFTIGIVFVIKGVNSAEQDAVPISDPNEIRELTKTFKTDETKTDSTIKTKKTKPFTKTGLQKEIDALAEENTQLRKQIGEQADRYELLEQKNKSMNQEYSSVKISNLDEINELRSKIAQIEAEKKRLLPNHQLIDELKSKSDLFEKQYSQEQSLQAQLRDTINRLESERDELLNMKNQQIDKTELEALNNRLVGSISAIESLKGENKHLQQANQNLKNNFDKTEEFNAHLVEKEKIMQLELAKNRAQSLGLEKICEDFKIQIETMSVMAANENK